MLKNFRLQILFTVVASLLLFTEYTEVNSYIPSINIANASDVVLGAASGCDSGHRMMYFALGMVVLGILTIPLGVGIFVVVIGKILLVVGFVIYLFQMAVC